jgi:hypothetical protein
MYGKNICFEPILNTIIVNKNIHMHTILGKLTGPIIYTKLYSIFVTHFYNLSLISVFVLFRVFTVYVVRRDNLETI